MAKTETTAELFEFDVTQEDIDCGQQGAPAACAIAMRLKKIEGIRKPSVCGSYIEFWLNDVWYHCNVHHWISEWISTFDHNRRNAKPIHVALTLNPSPHPVDLDEEDEEE
jgi:hypothetical protein